MFDRSQMAPSESTLTSGVEGLRVFHRDPAAAASVTMAANAVMNPGASSVAARHKNALATVRACAVRRTQRARAESRTSTQFMVRQTRLKTSVPLVPPKPNEFFIATSIFMSRAVLAQ